MKCAPRDKKRSVCVGVRGVCGFCFRILAMLSTHMERVFLSLHKKKTTRTAAAAASSFNVQIMLKTRQHGQLPIRKSD